MTAGTARQQWSTGLQRAHVLVNLENHSSEFDYHGVRERYAAQQGLGTWKNVHGLQQGLQLKLLENEAFAALQNEVRARLVALAREADTSHADASLTTLVVVVWCAHGKHRSVAFAEALLAWARDQPGHFDDLEVVHCERPRWDAAHRALWSLWPDTSLPLEWVLGTHLRLDISCAVPLPVFLRAEPNGRPRRWWVRQAALREGFFKSSLAPADAAGVQPPGAWSRTWSGGRPNVYAAGRSSASRAG